MEESRETEDLLVVGISGYLVAFRVGGASSNLQKIWTANVKGAFGIVSFVSIQNVCFALGNTSLCAINRDNGHLRWSVNVDSLFTFGDSHINKWSDSALICSGHGYVTSYSTTGQLQWTTNLEGSGYSPVITLVHRDVILAGTAGYVFALSPNHGGIIWKNSLDGKGYVGTSFCFPQNNVLSVGTAGSIVKLDPSSGSKIGGSTELPGALYMPVSQLLFKENLIVGSYGSVYCYNTSNYSIEWRNDLAGCGYHFGVSLSLLNSSYGASLIVGFHGHVVSIDPNYGKTNWTLSLPGSGYGFVSVLIQKNTIIAVSKGYLYVIDPAGTILKKDDLSGFGFKDAIIGSYDAVDQNSSNLIFARLSAQHHRSHQ